MDSKSQIEKVSSEAAMRFILGKYVVEQVGNGKDEVEFLCDGEVILKIRIRDDGYDFYIGGELPITVTHTDDFEIAKKMLLQKKKPNREPFPKENAVLCRNGDRCDLCYQYANFRFSDEFRRNLVERAGHLYDYEPNYSNNCPGGDIGFCEGSECRKSKGIKGCPDCEKYPCGKTGQVSCGIDFNSISADDITWLILPYVDGQYGN